MLDLTVRIKVVISGLNVICRNNKRDCNQKVIRWFSWECESFQFWSSSLEWRTDAFSQVRLAKIYYSS